MAHSLIEACVKTGMHVSLACPPGMTEPGCRHHAARPQSQARPARELETHRTIPTKAVKDADIVYTDVWASMGQESEHAKRVDAFQGYQVDAKLMKAASSEALVMHCLPAHRGEEIAADVIDGPQSVVFDQAENRLHTQKAVLELLIG